MGSVSLELTNAAWPLILDQSKDLCLLILDYTWFGILGLSLSIKVCCMRFFVFSKQPAQNSSTKSRRSGHVSQRWVANVHFLIQHSIRNPWHRRQRLLP
jgi:hypothetical protein